MTSKEWIELIVEEFLQTLLPLQQFERLHKQILKAKLKMPSLDGGVWRGKGSFED